MDCGNADRGIGFRSSPPSSPANVSSSTPVSNKQLSPPTGSLRARRFPSQRVVCADGSHHTYSHNNSIGSAGGGIVALARMESQELFGAYPPMPTLQHRHPGDSIVPLLGRPSLDSVCELLSNASPTSQAAVPTLSFYAAKDNVALQDYCTLPNQNSVPKSVTVIYSQPSSPSDAYLRGVDYVSARGISVTEDNANEDRVKVRVEGYYENNGVGVLIPNDLPPSTLLYVLTASDGRDLMFKVIQYSLQLTICFLKTPSLFSPEAQMLMGPMAERLYRNYNTIRHGRSLFKMGRGLLNLFTLQTVCERMWMKYKRGISHTTCAIMLPVVSCLEKGLMAMGASPLWGRYLSCRLLRWAQAAQVTPGRGRSEEPEDSVVPYRCIQQRAHEQPSTPSAKDALQTDGVHTTSGVEKAEQSVTAAQAASGSVAGLESLKGNVGFALQKVDGGGAGSSQPTPPCAMVDSQTSTSRVQSEQPSPTTGDGAASKGVGKLSLLPRAPSGGLSAEDWGGRASEIATALPTPNAESKRELTDPDALPCVPSGPAAGSASAMSSGAEGTAAPQAKPPHVPDTPFSGVELGHQEHQRHGLTPSTTANATASAFSLATADWVDSAGRKTLLHPLKQSSSINTPTPTASSSITGDDVGDHLQEGVESNIIHNGTPLIPAARSSSYGSITSQLMPELASGGGLTPADGPLSVPNNWRIACAPTVPPSRSDELVVDSALPCSSVELLKPLKPTEALSTVASPSEELTKVDGTTNSSFTANSADTRTPPPQLLSAADVSTNTQAAMASSGDNTGTAIYDIERNSRHASSLRDRCTVSTSAPQPPVTAVLQASELPVMTPTRAASALKDDPPLSVATYGKESEISIISSSTSSCLQEHQGNHAGALSTYLRELQPASAALPARWRKGVLQFNPVLMTLLGIRNLAAACRRFLRDITLVSTERFGTLRLVEVHRHTITHIINRCWLVVSIIDLLLNTVRLLQPGWVKYATARQNIHCRCGCYGDNDPSDKVWRTHGFIARRKTDLFFPPLDLDYGAPFVSSLSYVEAADPAQLMPACRRCGCLYREVLSDSDQEGDEAEVADASSGVSMPPSRTLAAMSKAALAATAASFSEDGHHKGESHRSAARKSLSTPGLVEREKPRWVQLYNEEVMLGESQQQRLRSPGARQEKQNLSTGAQQDSPVKQLEKARSNSTLKSSAGDGQPADEMLQRRKSGAARERPAESSAGILFVPWMMRKFFDYVWLLRVHPNLTSTVLLEARCIAELYLAYKYCFGNLEAFMSDAPLSAILNPYGALAGIVSASVGLLRVVESAPSS
ncbi:conserved hypothetical protein [Leishmania major strain Friedlin]|uniref:Uncharacterized protein n=1 Tax=Leishmania major TaxID=5664 RepID=Q4QHC1_LEIMA|nr:conserved hypothetical protein [Leishmania major strain Friedlin]CAG9570077.1 hypothetical_protein_-_conserved [Leishmania major strain Friedlin]CAJ02875.1 conserved hypothetical protein [Leishmania major strain Friedlin]|eukprot:XP_001681427.1 conserved hypothetical protein [Leishmania major strain Friedlin]